jgi:hypothetical protein
MREMRTTGDLSIHGRIILKYIIDKKDSKTWTGLAWLMIGPSREFW